MIIIFVILNMFYFTSCQNIVNDRVEQIDVNSEYLAEEVREAILKNKKLILTIGTGLCENCKIVGKTLKEYEKEKPNDIEILIFENYNDIKTFEILNITISPTTLLIDENHIVKKRIIGPFLLSELKEYLEEVELIN